MIIDQAKLDELKTLAEAATPGPWESTYGCVSTPSGDDVVGIEERGSPYLPHRELVLKSEDADYIAAANPQVVLSLIAELARLQTEVASLEAETMTLTSERDTARMTQDELRDLISESAPLAWAADEDMESAQQWEMKAHRLLALRAKKAGT